MFLFKNSVFAGTGLGLGLGCGACAWARWGGSGRGWEEREGKEALFYHLGVGAELTEVSSSLRQGAGDNMMRTRLDLWAEGTQSPGTTRKNWPCLGVRNLQS